MNRLYLLFLILTLTLTDLGCWGKPATAQYDFSTQRAIAHRGGKAEQEENTLDAFKATYNAGCHCFETDIHFDADKDFVIMHDYSLERMTDGQGKIEECSTKYLKSLRTKGGRPILFLNELLDYFQGCKTLYVEWELKVTGYTDEELDEYCNRVYPAVMSKKPADALYVFSSFDERPLLKIKKCHPEAEVMLITGNSLSRTFADHCLSLGIHRCACRLDGTSRDDIRYARRYDLKVNLWPSLKVEDVGLAHMLGSDYLCTDIPLQAMAYAKEHRLNIAFEEVARHPKKLVCMDLDGTLTQHKTTLSPEVKQALNKLGAKYHLLMVGGGSATRIHNQMNGYPIDILGNYGMQEARVVNGEWKIVRQEKVTVNKEEILAKCQALREKYGFTEYAGDPVEFHEGGMITFALLGTKADKAAKLAFDPDKKKRRAMYKDVCKTFPDFAVFIGGTTSFDMAPAQFNKYSAIMKFAQENGYTKDEIIFFGDDLSEGGNDSHVRFGGIECIRIEDYRLFPVMAQPLL